MSSNFVPQILPNFVTQRSIYEARERPAKTYSWLVFLLSNLLVELPWNTLMSVLIFVCWYYPVGFYRNAIQTDTVAERGMTMFLLMWVYMMYTSTFAHMIQAGVELAEMAGNFANLLFIFSLVFCGYVVSPPFSDIDSSADASSVSLSRHPPSLAFGSLCIVFRLSPT